MTPKLQQPDRQVLWAIVVALVVCGVEFLAARFNLKWDDPIGSLLTILAAFIGGYFILLQINAQKRETERQRKQKYLALRAALPLTLSHVTAYARTCVGLLEKIYATRNKPGGLTPISSLARFPDFPTEAITELRTLVEYCPQEVGEAVATLLQKVQVQRSRLDTVHEWNAGVGSHLLSTLQLEQHILDALEVHLRAEYLFEYARFEANGPRALTAQAMQGEYRKLLSDDPSEYLQGRLQRWRPRFEAKFRDDDTSG